MKKLFAILMALCLLCAATAALGETETEEIRVITLDEGVELTEADYEGDWIVAKVYKGDDLMTEEEVAEIFRIAPINITGKTMTVTYDEGNTETYTCRVEANQYAPEDENARFVFDKLNDGNVIMSLFADAEDGTTICYTFYLVHPEA